MRSCLTKENVARLFLCRGDSQGSAVGITDLAGAQPCAAGAAVARFAAMGEVQTGGERGVEDRLPGVDADRPAVRLDPNSEVIRRQGSITSMSLD